MPSGGWHEFGSNRIVTKYQSNIWGKRGQLNTLSLNCGWCQPVNSSKCYSKKSVRVGCYLAEVFVAGAQEDQPLGEQGEGADLPWQERP